MGCWAGESSSQLTTSLLTGNAACCHRAVVHASSTGRPRVVHRSSTLVITVIKPANPALRHSESVREMTTPIPTEQTNISVTYKDTHRRNGSWHDIADTMDIRHCLGLRMKGLASHKFFACCWPTDKGNIELSKKVSLVVHNRRNKTHSHELWVEKDSQERIFPRPILVKDRDVDA